MIPKQEILIPARNVTTLNVATRHDRKEQRRRDLKMAKEDLLPFKYDSKTNTVFNTSGAKIAPMAQTKPQSKSWLNTFFDLSARYPHTASINSDDVLQVCGMVRIVYDILGLSDKRSIRPFCTCSL